MTQNDWFRLAIHLPWGLLAVGLFVFHPLLGMTACFSTFVYELANNWRKGDSSYKDILGIVWGILIGGYVLLGLKLAGLL